MTIVVNWINGFVLLSCCKLNAWKEKKEEN